MLAKQIRRFGSGLKARVNQSSRMWRRRRAEAGAQEAVLAGVLGHRDHVYACGAGVIQYGEREPAESFDDDEIGVVKVNGINVRQGEGLMPTWVQEGYQWHINLQGSDRAGVYHVTREGSPMVHYSFKGTGTDIVGVQPSGKERGSRSIKKDGDGEDVHTKRSFSDLPSAVQDFVKKYWSEILG